MRKMFTKQARMGLRQMNQIGIDNVKGYSPEVLMKLNKLDKQRVDREKK